MEKPRTETSSAPSSPPQCCTSPRLLALDEPFAGLDPLAVRTLAEVLRGEAARGAAVLFFSHQLESSRMSARMLRSSITATSSRRDTSTPCDRLHGDGGSSSGSRAPPPEWLPSVAGVELVERRNGALRLLARRDVDPQQVLAAAERAARVVEFSYGPPSLAELFLELVAR